MVRHGKYNNRYYKVILLFVMGIPIHMDSQNIMLGLFLNIKFNHMLLAMNQSLNKNILLDINHMSFFQFLEHNNQSYISLDKMTLPHRNDL